MDGPDQRRTDSEGFYSGTPTSERIRGATEQLSAVLSGTTLWGLLYEMRPWQWYKQGILFVAIVFSGNLFDVTAWYYTILGVIAFSAVASSMYIFNDISDVEADRNHPEKKHRPIASGQVSIPVAIGFGTLLLVGALSLSYRLGLAFLLVIFVYIAQNVLYSLYLKEIVILDIMIIAIGFVLRALAGVFAIDVEVSPWLIVCTFLAALLLAIGKRMAEIEAVAESAETRTVLEEYTSTELHYLMVVVVASLLMSYTLYTVLTEPTKMLTLPFAFFGVLWYHHQVVSDGGFERPEYLLMEPVFVVTILLWVVSVVAIIYGMSGSAPGIYT